MNKEGEAEGFNRKERRDIRALTKQRPPGPGGGGLSVWLGG